MRNALELELGYIWSLWAQLKIEVRSALTILMVLLGSGLLVAVNAFGADFSDFFNKQFANLVPYILSSEVCNRINNGGGVIGSVAPTF